jgi:hypothetical protein
MVVNPDPRTSMPASTRAVVQREAAKLFDFPDDMGLLLLVFNNAEMVSTTSGAIFSNAFAFRVIRLCCWFRFDNSPK